MKVTDFIHFPPARPNYIYSIHSHCFAHTNQAVIHRFTRSYPQNQPATHNKCPIIHNYCAKRFSTFLLRKIPLSRTAEVVNFTRHIFASGGGAKVMQNIDSHNIKSIRRVSDNIIQGASNDNFVQLAM